MQAGPAPTGALGLGRPSRLPLDFLASLESLCRLQVAAELQPSCGWQHPGCGGTWRHMAHMTGMLLCATARPPAQQTRADSPVLPHGACLLSVTRGKDQGLQQQSAQLIRRAGGRQQAAAAALQ